MEAARHHLALLQRQRSASSVGGTHGSHDDHSGSPLLRSRGESSILDSAETAMATPGMPHASRFWPSYSSRPTGKGSMAGNHHHDASADDFFAAESTLLDNDEDDARETIYAERRQGFDEIMMEYQRTGAEIKARNVWDGSMTITLQQLENLYLFLFKAMRSRIQQHLSTVFPEGVSDTSLSSHDVAATVCCLLLLDIAITDDDMHSFALTVLPGQRVSLQNCPPERRFAYFSFMSLKAVVPAIVRGGSSTIDAFRRIVAKYFTLPLMPTPQPLALPIMVTAARTVLLPREASRTESLFAGHPPEFMAVLRALLNAAFPLLHSEFFESRVSAFYHHVVSLEAQLGSASSRFTIVEADSGELVTQASTSVTSLEQSANTPTLPRRNLEYHRGQVVGRGAFGVVYEAVCVDDGTVIALKEVHLTRRSKRTVCGKSMIATAAAPMQPRPPGDESLMSPRRETTADPDQMIEAETESVPNESMAGADGSEYLAAEVHTDATKTVRLGSTMYDGANIEAEINMLRRLHHPNIVQYYGCQIDKRRGVATILMEFVPKSLRKVIDNFGEGGLPDKLVAHYGKGILQGLVYLHDHHIVHRDIKAANILVRNSGEVKVSDFGTAVVTQSIRDDPDGNSSVAGVTVQGTPAFLAPEVLAGSTPLEPSDIWAFGGVLMELSTGCAPFAVEGHEALMQIAFQLLVERRAPAIPDKVGSPIREMIVSCMAMDPCGRPSARQLLANPFFAQAM